MATGTKLVSFLNVHLARALSRKQAAPLILAGTMAVAGFGAAAVASPNNQQTPSHAARTAVLILDGPHTFCMPDADGDGHTICHVPASQVSAVPNLGCSADPDGDGTFICYYASDPTAAN